MKLRPRLFAVVLSVVCVCSACGGKNESSPTDVAISTATSSVPVPASPNPAATTFQQVAQATAHDGSGNAFSFSVSISAILPATDVDVGLLRACGIDDAGASAALAIEIGATESLTTSQPLDLDIDLVGPWRAAGLPGDQDLYVAATIDGQPSCHGPLDGSDVTQRPYSTPLQGNGGGAIWWAIYPNLVSPNHPDGEKSVIANSVFTIFAQAGTVNPAWTGPNAIRTCPADNEYGASFVGMSSAARRSPACVG